MGWPKITKNTPVEKVFEIHRMIWNDLLKTYQETGSIFDDFECIKKPHTPYLYDCALCEYSVCHSLSGWVDCEYCPADWGLHGGCKGYWSLYNRLFRFRSESVERITFLIEAIRDIKPKEELTNGERKYAEGSGRVSE